MPKREPGPYAVICPNHGQVFLSSPEYDWQMNRPNSLWRCPDAKQGTDSGLNDAEKEYLEQVWSIVC